MIKKLSLLAMAVAALAAFAVPASASASSLTMPAGTLVPVNTAITGVGVNLETTTSLGTIVCTNVMLNGEVTKNSGGVAEGVGTAGSTATGCTFTGGKSATVSNIEIGTISSSTSGKGLVTFSYTAKIPVGGKEITCEFETPEPSEFTYTSGTDLLNVAILLESELCGESEIHGGVTFETASGGGSVLFD